MRVRFTNRSARSPHLRSVYFRLYAQTEFTVGWAQILLLLWFVHCFPVLTPVELCFHASSLPSAHTCPHCTRNSPSIQSLHCPEHLTLTIIANNAHHTPHLFAAAASPIYKLLSTVIHNHPLLWLP